MNEPFISLARHHHAVDLQQDRSPRPATEATNGKAAATKPAQYLQLVISASYDLLQKPRQEIIDLCLRRKSVTPCRQRARQTW